MTILTKNYRLVWSGNDILHDPFMEFGNSQTIINNDSCFESNDIEEIKDKIMRLGLIYDEGNKIIDDLNF